VRCWDCSAMSRIINGIQERKRKRAELFLSQHENAITIVLDDQTKFYLDKEVVTLKSHYFSSLFSNNWIEGDKILQGVPILISDISSENMKIILCYLYIDEIHFPYQRIEDFEEMFQRYWNLVYCAHFFGILDFEEELSCFFYKYISPETVF